MVDIDALFADVPTEAERVAMDKASLLFADIPDEKPADETGWVEGAVTGTLNTGARAGARLQQGGSQLMLEQTAGRAADRKRSFSEILEDEQLSSGLTDMQGKPMKTNTGGEYVSAAARWIDAKYADMIGTDDEAAAQSYAESMQKHMDEVASIPKSQIAQAFEKKAMVKDATLGQTLANFGSAILDNPVGGFSWMLETAGESAPQIGAAVIGGALTKNPAVGIGLMGGGSYATERYTSPGEFFQEKGLDLKKPEDREKLLNDPKMMAEAADRGMIRGLIIGGFDALSGGIAGKALIKNPFAEALAQTMTQGLLGAGGEYGARKAAGQKIDWGEVVAEGFAELVTTPFDMVAAARGERPGTADEALPAGDVLPAEPPVVPPGAAPAAPPEAAPAAPAVLEAAGLPKTPENIAVAESVPEQVARQTELPDSPRLTPADRASPIPNEIIDAGRATVEAATGQESSFTTTKVVDGHRQVVNAKVSDLVAANRVETQAVVSEIMQGVDTPEILAQPQPAAAPASTGEMPGTLGPVEASASVAPSMAETAPVAPTIERANQPPPAEGSPLAEQIKKFKARSAARDVEVSDLTASGKSIKLVSNRDPTRKAMVGPDMSEPGKFRVTYIDEQGPSGHTVYDTMEEAARSVVGSYHPVGNIAKQVVKKDVAITPAGREVPVVYAVVEADDLVSSQRDEGGANPAYPQELQPRDRSRGTSDVQINQIAQNLNPALLDNVASATDGAPIVSADGVVESGNGRVLGIRKAYKENLPGGQTYRQYLVDQGYIDTVAAKEMKNPVLVRIRQGQMEPGERTAFTREANERTTMTLSATEKAMADAEALSPDTVGLYRGGEVAEAGNRDFVRSFMQSVVSPNEQGAMVTPDGELSQEAIRRVQAALLARAYGDADLVGALVESTDNNIKAIGGAMMDVAGAWSQMRSESKEGTISPDVDVTPFLLEAIRLVQRARNEGKPLSALVSQTDIFSGTTIVPEAEMLLRLMFRNNVSWTQPAGREKLAEALRYYVTEARKTAPGIDLLGETAPPANKILEQAKKRQYGTEETQEKLTLGGGTAGKNDGAPAGGRAVEAQPRPKPENRPAVPGKTREEAKLSVPEAGTRVTLPGGQTATIEHPDEETFRITVDGKRVGEMHLTLKRAAPYATSVSVIGERRLGVATALYDAAEKVLGRRLIPSPLGLSPEAIAFWKNRLGKMEPGEKQALLAEALKIGQDAGVGRTARDRVDSLGYREEAKFKKSSLPGPLGAAVDRMNKLRLEKRLNSPEIAEAIKAMADIPVTFDPKGPPVAQGFWDSRARTYNFAEKGERPHRVPSNDAAVEVLVERARSLAVDELNGDRKKAGQPPLEPYIPSRDRKATIIIGPPAAGKSTIANAIALRMRAAIADVDDAKKVIPEYGGGIGANAVHEESSVLGEEVLERLMNAGDNIIIPKVGHKLASIEKLRENLKLFNYDVELVLMDVDPRTAVGRMLGRFKSSGRLINPTYFLDVVGEPPVTYDQAKKEGKFDGYSRVKSENNVPTRVHEAIGKAASVARGEIFERSGEIGTGRPSEGRGDERGGKTVRERPQEAKLKTAEPAPQRGKNVDVQGGVIHYATSPGFEEKADAVLADLRKALDKLGLTGVDLGVWQQIFADLESGPVGPDGVYLRNVIDISLQSADPDMVLHHEAVHAMVGLGLLTDSEMNILNRKSKKEWITDAIKERYPESQWVEEGIAHAYTDWINGTRMDGMIARSFKKIKTFLKALYQTLTNHDIRTADDVFRQMTSGEVGKRSAGADTRKEPSFAVTETVDMFEGKREQYVLPGAEKLTDAQMAQRKAEERMTAKTAQKSVEALPLFGDQKDQLALFSKPPSGPNDPRFNLNVPPHTTTQAAAVTQGFLNRGQFVDRAIRVPFQLFGGLDSQNRWRATKRLTDMMGPQRIQAGSLSAVIGGAVGGAIAGPIGGVAGFFAAGTAGAYILGSAPAPANGKFGWFKSIAENGKRGLIDGYGLDPAYIEAYQKSDLGKAAIMRKAQDVLKVLSNAGVSAPEAKVLQAVLTGENVTDADMIKLAVPIRKAIDDMGAEAVSLGLISAESFERNRASYLHRVYTKNEIDQSTLAGWVSAKMTGRRKKIIGDQLKGRGMFMDIETDRLMQDVDSFKSGKRGGPQLNEKFRVIDEVSSTPNLNPTAPASDKVLRRIYLPTNEAVPAKYQGPNWVDRGTWEVRKSGAKQTLWRDYTKEERGKMGELVDARYTIAKTFMLMANDLSTGRFFKEVSEKDEWTRSMQPPDGQWKEASEYNQYWNDPEIQWVKVPDTNIADTGGKKRWGALANKFVRAEIWRDLNEVNIANNPGTWRILLTQWKKNKTARNPVVHMNNVVSNLMFMDLADVRAQDLVAGIKAFAKGDVHYQEALDNGAFGGDMVAQEIRDEVFKPLLDAITKQSTGAGNPFLAKAGMVGVVADKLWTWAKAADNGMLRAYQAEDQIFRMATYMRRRSQGESPKVAAANARDQFLNYDIRAPWIRAMRNSFFPFISYTYRAVPMLAENFMHRPWKVAKYVAIAFAVNALSYMFDDGDDGEERERAALRDEEQGYSWLGTPRMVRMPWRDAHGLPVFLDVRRWVPAGDIFDTTQGSSALPIPAPLMFGGPMMLAVELMLNKSAFTGEEIINELTDTSTDKAAKIADYLWKAWMPNSFWTPNSWYWTKISNALHGATDSAGRPYSIPQAVASSFGIKIKPLDVEDGIKWHFYDFQKVQKELKSQLRSASGRLDRGLISQSAFDAEAAAIMAKFETLGGKIDTFSRQTEKKPKP